MTYNNNKEPKIVRVPNPGDGKFWETVNRGTGPEYVFYHPPTPIKPAESWSFDSFTVVEEEDRTIHYRPDKKIVHWELPGELAEPGDDLWDEIKAFVYSHIDLPDPRLYDVLTGWIFMTWIPEPFTVSPYIKFGGVKNVGKTRGLEVVKYLARRAMLATSASDAALYRLIESHGVVFCLDETEVYGAESRQSMQNLLNSGYRRGQTIPRCETAEDGSTIVVGYSAYGPKCLAGTNFLKDTLESRCISIIMTRNRRPVNFMIDQGWARRLRSKLLLWRFRRLADYEKPTGDSCDSCYPSDGIIEAPPELQSHVKDNRLIEIYSPLITLSEGEARQNIVDYALTAYAENQEEEGSGVEASVLSAIIECSNYLQSGKFTTRQVADNFNLDKPDNEKWRTQSVGKVIKSLGFKSERLSRGVRGYVYDAKLIERLSDRYLPPLPLEPSLQSQQSLESHGLDAYTETPL